MGALSLITALLNRSETFCSQLSSSLPSARSTDYSSSFASARWTVCNEFARSHLIPSGLYHTIRVSYGAADSSPSSSTVLRVLCLHSLAALADASFSRNIALTAEERHTLITEFFSQQSVIAWVGHFDTHTPAVECVVMRLLFILISTPPPEHVAALCHTGEYSVLPVLLTFTHTMQNAIYVCHPSHSLKLLSHLFFSLSIGYTLSPSDTPRCTVGFTIRV